MTKAAVSVKIKPNVKLVEPPFYRVLYKNDEVTTMQFVVNSLIQYFGHTDETATDLTELIHNNGSATVAVLPYEIAEQKMIEVMVFARSSGFPLQVTIEADS